MTRSHHDLPGNKLERNICAHVAKENSKAFILRAGSEG